jgi:FKBP-type peptidyl-prolyl cis-trans isomerase
MSIDTLKKLGMIPDYNNIFTKNDVIKGRLEILKVYNNESDVNADYQKEMESEKQKEVADLDKYISGKKIKAQKTPNGVFVEVQNPGTEPKADTGKQVSVYYSGYLLKNGNPVAKPFDTNVGKDATHKDVFKVVLGSHSVIPGWEEGLKLLGKGGKGKIYIPAMLAYGMQGQPPVIPPYSTLIFDVEIADITVPAPQPTAQAAPPMPMRQMPQHK